MAAYLMLFSRIAQNYVYGGTLVHPWEAQKLFDSQFHCYGPGAHFKRTCLEQNSLDRHVENWTAWKSAKNDNHKKK